MSTASKVTFGLTCVSAVGAFIFINYSQQLEREAFRQGPIKDAARIEARQMTKKMKANELEHREQIELRQKLEKIQPLNLEIIRGEDTSQ
ncbi:uncharacterized protein CANTADRAFT_92056 [Suhomyces tanzawaensis NRRL Y-17324]|uniref:Cytochrome c oxidase assembly protein n=1 Tax=Suhomyces tanzawaensis NRRL Y-17324 TaxID=984487 RepID=A0A1E4SDP9_9ASCO|nr:uncharacterized protein CANTADRAFT_92056 [Suhomyces tanzawaensis NRRL Y-17324]ODV77640.1 hypothetical protein CANTADRAFT_92056 [Suhomyces tanzawaensis NRRL Y-17324]